MALTYQRITELDALRDLAEPWRELLQDSGVVSAPLSFEWHLAWWECFGLDGNLAIGCIYDEDELIAISPMMSAVAHLRGIKLKTFQLMNNGYSPFGGLIYSSSLAARRLVEVVELLLSNHKFDVLRLQKLPEKSPLYSETLRHLFPGLRMSTLPSLQTPIIPVTGSWDEYLQGRSKSFRKSIRRKLKKFDNQENAEIREYVVHNRADPILETIFDVSALSWKVEEGSDLRSDDDGREFFRRLIDFFGHQSKILVWVLYLDDRPVAFEFLLTEGGVVFPVRADFDKSKPELSPGTVLLCHVLQAMFARDNIHCYDCCSDDYAYLQSWTEQQRDHQDIEFFRTSFKPLVMYTVEHRIAPVVRKLKRAAAGPLNAVKEGFAGQRQDKRNAQKQ